MKAQMKWSAFTLCVTATVLALVWFASAVADLSGGFGGHLPALVGGTSSRGAGRCGDRNDRQ